MPPLKSDCIFCQIASSKIETQTKIFENDYAFVFLSTGPINPGHALVIPKGHYENIYEIPDEILKQISVVTKKTAMAVKDATQADGINVNMNNEKASGQAVFHAHWHIIPRYYGDGYKSWENDKKYKIGEAEELAEKIKADWK
jgi:histidine triad (HIT) family protein